MPQKYKDILKRFRQILLVDSREIDAAMYAWRERVLNHLFVGGTVVGFPAVGSVILDALRDATQWPAAIGYIIIYLLVIGLAVYRRLNVRMRGWLGLSLIYAAGLLSMARGGLAGDGRIFLLVLPVLAIILVDIRSSIVMACFSLGTHVLFAILARAGILENWLIRSDNTLALADWISAGLVFALLIVLLLILLVEFYLFQMRTLESERQIMKEYATTNQDLMREISERKRSVRLQNAIYRISEAANFINDLDNLFKLVHQILGEFTPARNFYIAIYDAKKEVLHFPYFFHEYLEHPPSRKFGNSLTERVITTGEPLLLTSSEMRDILVEAGTLSDERIPLDWLGVPLKTAEGNTIGVLVTQNYLEGKRIKELDKSILVFVSTQIAMAIERKQSEDALRQLNNELESIVEERTKQLEDELVERRRAEGALLESETRKQGILNALPDIMFLQDEDGIYLDYYAANENELLLPPEDFLGKNPKDVLPTDLTSKLEPLFHRLRETGELQVEEYSVELDGERTYFEARIARADQNSTVSIIRNITEKKKAERIQSAVYRISEAANTAQNLEILFGLVHEIVGDLLPAENFYISIYNEVAGTISFPYYIDEHDAPGQPHNLPPVKIGRGLTEYLIKLGKPLWITGEVLNDMVAAGEVDLVGSLPVEWLGIPLKTVDDNTIGVLALQTYAEGTGFNESDKQILGFVSTQIAMAIERKKAEDALRESEERYRSLFENANDAILLENENDEIIDVNLRASELYGYSREELLIMKVPDLQAPEVRMEEGTAIRTGLDKFGTSPIESLDMHRDGTRIPVEVSLSRLSAADGDVISIVRDLSLRKSNEAEMQLQASALRAAANSILITDPKGDILWVNPAFIDLTGYTEEEVIGKNPRFLRSGKHDASFYKKLWKTISKGDVWKGEIINRRKNGMLYTQEITITPVHGTDNGQITHYIGIVQDISERVRMEEKLTYQTMYDSLTDLPNRHLLIDRLNQSIAQAQRDKMLVGVVHLDLDHFKDINDTLGHMVGDDVLKLVAHRLAQNVRLSDTLARMGGDEFIIVLNGLTDPETALQVTQKLVSIFKTPFNVDGNELYINVSIGISVYPHGGKDAVTLLKNADSALVFAKDRGKNNIRMYESYMSARARKRLELETNLYQAIERDELKLYYQPQVDLSTNAVVGMEALIRWQHPDLGIITPDMFIPLAEKSGMIGPIGDWVINEACRQSAIWRHSISVPFRVSINVSPIQFTQLKLLGSIERALETYNLPAENLAIEITENIFLHDKDDVALRLHKLREMGIRIDIDDFGTDYSSLGYLRKLPVDSIKIDKSFIHDLSTHDVEGFDHTAFVNSIIAMAHGLNLVVVAEGVETEEQLEILRSQGCDYAQGYLFAHPLPADKVWSTIQAMSIAI
jgi:diguanylate cyclase (GGDEF)-like protein/PAS domain S-box-containing protein